MFFYFHICNYSSQPLGVKMNLKENAIVSKDRNSNFSPINRLKQEEKLPLQLVNTVTKDYSKKLKRFQERNLNVSHINYKVVHLLHDTYTFVNAYAKISKNKGALTKGVLSDEQTMEFFGQIDALKIAEKFKKNSYLFKSTRRTFIPKLGKKSKMRPIDTPTQEDRIVQEAIRDILECIYEPEFVNFENKTNFKATNFGFRSGKSYFNAVQNFKKNSQSCNYIIEGDIVAEYNSINHDILLNILRRRIKDRKFLDVLKQLLESGIMKKNHYIHSLAGVPQGGILSPLLFNIYMFEFDKFMYKIINKYNIEQKPKKSTEYESIRYKIRKLIKEKPLGYKTELKKLITIRHRTPSYDLSSIQKHPIFVRYADYWLFGINTTKKETLIIKEKICRFLRIFLGLELYNIKTTIKHYQRDGTCFLGYQIKMWSNKQLRIKTILSKNKGKFIRTNQRTTSRKITIRPEKDRIMRNLYIKKICQTNGYPIGVRAWSILEEYRIVERYKSIMLGITNYYIKCDNLYILNQVSYILLYSCAKTLAVRKKITMSQVFQKYGKNLKISLDIKYKDKVIPRYVEFSTFTDLKTKGFIDKGQNRASINKAHDPFHLLFYNRTK